MSNKVKKRVIFGVIALFSVVPLYCCASVFYGVYGIDWRLDMNMRRYPGAHFISTMTDPTFYDNDMEAIYELYWTSDDIEAVKQYYSTIALPFLDNRTVFYPFGGSPSTPEWRPSVSNPWYREPYEDMRCGAVLAYDCVQLELVEYPSEALGEPPVYLLKDEIDTVLDSADLDTEMVTLIAYRLVVYTEMNFYSWH